MEQRMFFIHHGNTRPVLADLASAIVDHEIVSLLGCEATGKSWLLRYVVQDYWLYEAQMQGNQPRVIHAEIMAGLGKTRERASTPTTVDLFTSITEGLTRISRKHDSELTHLQKTWYSKPQPQYTDRQFRSLFAFVRDEVKRLRVSALLIDNAHLLDDFTLERLMDLRRLCGHQLALIFTATIEKTGGANDHLTSLLDVIVRQKYKETCLPDVELVPLTPEETWGPVLKAILRDHLHVAFDPRLSKEEVTAMRSLFWEDTQGDWKVIDIRRRRLEKHFGPSRNQRRFLTREIFEQVMGKPLPSVPRAGTPEQGPDLEY